MTSLAASLASLPAPQRDAILASLSQAEKARLRYEWRFWARPEQLPPAGEWTFWLLMAGRGFGKTRSITAFAQSCATKMPGSMGMVAAATSEDLSGVVLNGPSGLCTEASPPWNRPVLRQSQRDGTFIVWPNGSRAFARSAEEPDRFRGPGFTWAVVDELAAWKLKQGQHGWPMLKLGLREPGPNGERPRCAIATTPRPTKYLRELLKDAACTVTRGSTYDNEANLAPEFFREVIQIYEGTRLGRQELYGELLEDVEGALWWQALLDACRMPPGSRLPYHYDRVVVAIDPAVTSGEESDKTGITVSGRVGTEGYVLENVGVKMTPENWARKAVGLFYEHGADRIIGEVNNGGDLVETVLRSVDPGIPYKAVHASRGKRMRAEPVAALYEQKRIKHARIFDALEEQMLNFVPDVNEGSSPDELDSLVYALTELFLGNQGWTPAFGAARRH